MAISVVDTDYQYSLIGGNLESKSFNISAEDTMVVVLSDTRNDSPSWNVYDDQHVYECKESFIWAGTNTAIFIKYNHDGDADCTVKAQSTPVHGSSSFRMWVIQLSGTWTVSSVVRDRDSKAASSPNNSIVTDTIDSAAGDIVIWGATCQTARTASSIQINGAAVDGSKAASGILVAGYKILSSGSSAYGSCSLNGDSFWTACIISLRPPSDVGAPVISDVTESELGTTSVKISWTTDEAADSQVEYGLTTSYGNSTTLDETLSTSHAQTISGLIPGTTYHYRCRSRDSSGNLGTSSDGDFTTSSVVYGSPIESLPAFSVMAVFKSTCVGTQNLAVESVAAAIYSGIYLEGQSLRFTVDEKSTYAYGTIEANTWYIITAIHDNSLSSAKTKLYINGTLQATANATRTTNAGRMCIGSDQNETAGMFSGSLAKIDFFSRAIYDSERRALEAALAEKYGITL